MHDIQTHTIYSPIDVEEKVVAKSIGCLCELNPSYMRNKPSRWVHAFNTAYVRDDGTFNDYTTVITRGRFIAPDGKLDIPKIKPLARMGYYDYTAVESVFEMEIPGMNKELIDGLEGNTDKRKV